MLTGLIVIIISYCGLFIGREIGKFTKEEVAFGKKNLALLQSVLFVLILIWFFYAVQLSVVYKILVALFLAVVVYGFKNNYALLGIMVGLNPGYVLSSLVFLYGFPSGSLMKGSRKEIFRKTWIYFVFALIAYAIKNYLLL